MSSRPADPAAVDAGDWSATTVTIDPQEAGRTHRWRGVVGVAILVAVVGVLSNRPTVLLLAGVPTVAAAYPWLSPVPASTVTVRRRVSDARPPPGDPVEVTVEVENAGERTLVDCRIVDGVPPGLGVVEGSPRRGCVLRPGATASFSYTVESTVGCHRFAPTTVLVRDASGASEIETSVSVDSEIRCRTDGSEPPLRADALAYLGRIPGNRTGSGLAFHSLREYRPGDPARRISWSQYARTGEPATVDFQREQRAEVILLIDARRPAYRGTGDGTHAVQASVAAAELLAAELLDAGNPVGLATFGRNVRWLGPGVGRTHRSDLRRLLATDPVLAPTAPDEETDLDDQFQQVASRIGSNRQLLVFSPLLDDLIATTIRKFDALGVPASIVSPDVTGTDTPGQRVAGTERETRIKRLRRAGVPVLDWDPHCSLRETLTATRPVVQ